MSLRDRLGRALSGGVRTGLDVYLGLTRAEEERERLAAQAARQAEQDRIAAAERAAQARREEEREGALRSTAALLARQNPDRFSSPEEAYSFLRSGAPMGLLPEEEEPVYAIPSGITTALAKAGTDEELDAVTAQFQEYLAGVQDPRARAALDRMWGNLQAQFGTSRSVNPRASSSSSNPFTALGGPGIVSDEWEATGAMAALDVNMAVPPGIDLIMLADPTEAELPAIQEARAAVRGAFDAASRNLNVQAKKALVESLSDVAARLLGVR